MKKAGPLKDKDDLEDLMKKGEKAVEGLTKCHSDCESEASKASSEWKTAEKECGSLERALRQRIEERWEKQCKVFRSSYHGGDMEGNQCRRLCQFEIASCAMDIFKEEALSIPKEDRDADDAEVIMYADPSINWYDDQ